MASHSLPFSLKYRFELNLKDVQFVVESLLVGLKTALFEELNVEDLTNQLKQKQIQTINKSGSVAGKLASMGHLCILHCSLNLFSLFL